MTFAPQRLDGLAPGPDTILVVGAGAGVLDILRLATIRSDDVVLVGDAVDHDTRRYAARFAIEHRERSFDPGDLAQANAVLIALGDVAAENAVVRAARRSGVPLHVTGRPLVSDFSLLAFLERHAASTRTPPLRTAA